MANTDTSLWPYNPDSRKTTHRIDWLEIDVGAMRCATPNLIKAADKADLQRLRDDRRFAHLLEALPAACQDLVVSITSGALPAKKEREPAPADARQQIKQELRRILSEAEAESDYSAQLKALETEGKLDALFSEKAKVDQVVNIFVNTGVPRG